MMKEFKKEEILPLEKVKSKIWMMFDILRSENISSDDYHVVLFLLSAFKDDLVTVDIVNNHHHLRKSLSERFHNSNHECYEQYAPIIQSFEPSIQRLSDDGIRNLLSVLAKINKQVLIEHFSDVFDSVLYRISQSQGRYAGEFIQPIELTRFMCGLVDLKKDAKVFNPFAGLASFGVYLDQGQEYFGQELNQKTWALGALRLMAYNRPVSSKYICDDSILHWPNDLEKFDLIVTSPPLGIRLGHHYRDIEPNFRTIEQFLIEKGVQTLKQNGKLIALLPQAFLFSGGQAQRLREHLVDEDLIDTIISLPGGLLLNTGIPLIILVLSKNKKFPGKVKFVDAKNYVITKGPREKVLNDQQLLSQIMETSIVDYTDNQNIIKEPSERYNSISSAEGNDILRLIEINQIKEQDYNLSVARYFRKHIDGVKLGDLIEIYRGQSDYLPKTGKQIRLRDLKDDKVDFTLDVSIVEETELRPSDIHNIVSESCLLLALRSGSLKPTLFEFNGEPIYRSLDILSFKVNEAIVNKAYLINELHSDYVQEQLESFRLQTYAMPYIHSKDLMEVIIKLPSIEEQRAKVQGIYELSDKIKSLQEDRNALAHGVSSKLYESVSTIKHSLGKPLLNIGSSLRNIENALSKLNADWERAKLNERYELTIKDTFDSIYGNLELIHSMLRNNESVLDVSNYELTEIDFLAFIKGYVNSIKTAERLNVNTKLDIHPDIKIQLKNKILIQANAELLEIGLNAIVENANMHAFTDDSKKYKLEFRVSFCIAPSEKKQADEVNGKFDTYIKVEVANNGKPIPKNYSLEKLIRKNSFAGETGNTGQGGFDLNEIIKYHNNGVSTLDLLTDDFTTEFTTTYSFLIPFNR